MGIYGALSTAVTGLQAQSFALQNISGNIANSQTVGYKRMDTSFIDMIPDAPLKQQVPGAVMAYSRNTNDVQGDVQTASTETFMALNGSGFFVVEPPSGQADGDPTFSGQSYYTRRGDFQIDKSGYLVNGAGYYLKGLAVDPKTGNTVGSSADVIKLSNSFLPAQQTSAINYKLNLPQLPKNGNYQQGVKGSELLRPGAFGIEGTATATAIGAAVADDTVNADTLMKDGETMQVTVGGTTRTYEFDNDGSVGEGNIAIDVTSDAADPDGSGTVQSVADALAAIQTDLQANGGAAAAAATVGVVGGKVQITLGAANKTDTFTVADGTTGLGIDSKAYTPTYPAGVHVPTITAADADEFQKESIAGGSITVYSKNGGPVNVEMRWAKVDSAETGGKDTWNLYYMSDSTATGGKPMWTAVDKDFTFSADGSLNPAVDDLDLNGLKINGVDVGDLSVTFGKGGVTQQADPDGSATVTTLTQNGYGAGEYQSVAISDGGRVVASYSNGQQVEVAQVVVADFNAPNQLKRLDGGVYQATADSGEPVIKTDAPIQGSALEASNTDISEEFTKLITTQQAYSAGTKIVSTANDMMQAALNMIR
ncbi:MAG TPA: flagellar hook-basal body complex protein [Devosiaceae bacterium]|jgi:flagellar hook protein FlgE